MKTLSSMIRERKMEVQAEEDEREREEMDKLDEEESLLRELEEDMYMAPTRFGEGDLDREGFLENDVRGELSEIEKAEDEAAEKTGFVRKVFKKKGLKRQTRRSNSMFCKRGIGTKLIMSSASCKKRTEAGCRRS